LPGTSSELALYGALHSCTLVLSIGSSSARSMRRTVLLVAGGAMLAMLTARLGLYGLKAIGPHATPAAPAMVVAAVAALGAFAYGASIRKVLAERPGAGSLVAISLACAAVAAVSFEVCRRRHSAEALWMVVPWWFAFSGGLWCAARVAPTAIRGAMPIPSQSR
jgi:hypothetical protein